MNPICWVTYAESSWTSHVLSSGTSSSHGGGGVSSLRVLRLLRVFRSLKLLRQVEGLNKIVNIVLKASTRPIMPCLVHDSLIAPTCYLASVASVAWLLTLITA